MLCADPSQVSRVMCTLFEETVIDIPLHFIPQGSRINVAKYVEVAEAVVIFQRNVVRSGKLYGFQENSAHSHEA